MNTNTKRILIARIQAGVEALESHAKNPVGTIYVHSIEASEQAVELGADPIRYVVSIEGGTLPNGEESASFATARRAMKYASDTALLLIYDECDQVTH